MNNRYQRQTILPEIGYSGQQQLRSTRVLVVGVGGLGCPAVMSLAGAGLGTLILVDPDHVEISNLHRQPLYFMSDLGKAKVEAAKTNLLRYNPDVTIDSHAYAVTPRNVLKLVESADMVLDCADSFALTYMLNDACWHLGKPLISASALGFSGYIGGFCAGAPSYRAVFPDMPGQAANCASAGVLGPIVSMFGAMQAQWALQWLLGLSPSPLGRLLSYDGRNFTFGGFNFLSAPEPATPGPRFIALEQIETNDIVVDLRGSDEAPVTACPQALRVGVEDVDMLLRKGPRQERIVLCCRSGLRAARAARILQSHGHYNNALIALGN